MSECRCSTGPYIANVYRSRFLQHNIPIKHEARHITAEDFRTFTYILASDESNLRNLSKIKPSDSTAEVLLFGSYIDGKQIPDPYYGGLVNSHCIRIVRMSDTAS